MRSVPFSLRNFTIMKMVIIGTGNVAYHLIKRLSEHKSATLFLHGRNSIRLSDFKKEFPDIQILSNYNLSQTKADLILICVKDDALNDVFHQYTYSSDSIIAHTSGSQKVISNFSDIPISVFYPLQTFSQSAPLNWNNIPILIEASSDSALAILEKVVDLLGSPYFETDEKQRMTLHLAAVITSNFINHLIGKAEVLLQKDNINYHILKPLIEETIRKAFTNHPFSVQTGPAIRNDQTILDKHHTLLENEIILQKIYTDITESIRKTGNLGLINNQS